MKKFKKMIPHLIVNVIAFYLVPLTGQDTTIMIFITPIICAITSAVYGYKNQMSILYIVLVALLFAPTLIVHNEQTALFYIFVYAIISALGDFMGVQLYRLVSLQKKIDE